MNYEEFRGRSTGRLLGGGEMVCGDQIWSYYSCARYPNYSYHSRNAVGGMIKVRQT